MNRRKFELVLAAVFFLVGFFLLIFSQTGTTGGFIGGFDIIESTTMFIGLLALFSGLVIYAGRTSLEGIMTKQEILPLNKIKQKITDIEPEKSKRVLVLDTGFFINYRKNPVKLNEFLKSYDRIYTTQEAHEGLGSHIKNVLDQRGCKILREDALKESSELAETYLFQTKKAMLADEYIPFFRENDPVPLPTSRVERTKFMKRLVDEGLLQRVSSRHHGAWNYTTASENPTLFRKAVYNFLDKDCRVTPGDKDVVATAARLALKPGNSVIVATNDSHVKEAVDMIHSKEGLNVHYVGVGHA